MPSLDEYHSHLDTILYAALMAANPAEALRRHWNPDDLIGADRIFVVGAGKAGVAMGEMAARLIGSRLTGGVIAVPQTTNDKRQDVASRLSFVVGGHPQPDSGSLQAGEAVAQLLADTTDRDLVIALISGGGSALLEKLNPGLTLDDLQTLNSTLLRSGAPIQEINCVRKHISQIKGGGLAKMAYPARVVAYILSDVIGDPLDVIASGPTVPDPTTVEEARALLESKISRLWPKSEDFGFLLHLRETPKPGDPIFDRVTNRLVGSNALARQAAAEAARGLGFNALLPDVPVQGEARGWWSQTSPTFAEVGDFGLPTAWIFGGETTVTMRGAGKGGRNQELVLSAAIALDGSPQRIAVAALGTDGVDGFSPAAGAMATPESCARARVIGLDPVAMLNDNDSYSFFNALGDCIVTGPTGTNVNDLVVVLIY